MTRKSRNHAQGPLFSLPADHDGWVGALRSLRLTAGIPELEVAAFVSGGLVLEQRDHHGDILLEAVHALLHGQQLDAVCIAFCLMPARTESQIQTSPRDDVQRSSHVRQQGGMAIWTAVHHASDPDAPGRLGECRKGYPGLHAGTRSGFEKRVEVVEVPSGLEDGDLVRGPPDVDQLFPTAELGCRLDSEAHGISSSGLSLSRASPER